MERISLISCIKRYIKGLQPVNVHVSNTIVESGRILDNKNIVITGASRGIGLAIAKICISQGATIIAIAKHSDTLAKARSNFLVNQYIPIPFDLRKFDDYDRLYHDIVSVTPNRKVDVLINAAGIKNGQENRFWDFTSSDFDECIDINSKAPFFLSRFMAKHMIDNDIKGHIINIIGIKGFIGEPSPYSMSKFGLNSLTKGMARILAPKGIIVNAIAPGATKTTGDENYFLADTSNGRFASPDEIANIALLLASDMCNSMVGSIVVCDGGEMIQYRNNRY